MKLFFYLSQHVEAKIKKQDQFQDRSWFPVGGGGVCRGGGYGGAVGGSHLGHRRKLVPLPWAWEEQEPGLAVLDLTGQTGGMCQAGTAPELVLKGAGHGGVREQEWGAAGGTSRPLLCSAPQVLRGATPSSPSLPASAAAEGEMKEELGGQNVAVDKEIVCLKCETKGLDYLPLALKFCFEVIPVPTATKHFLNQKIPNKECRKLSVL